MDKGTLLAGNQAVWELSEGGIVEALTVFLIGFVEDHRQGIGSLLYCIGRSGTLLWKYHNLNTAKVHSAKGYRDWGVIAVSFETISAIKLAL